MTAVSDNDIWVLSFYGASELAGSLIMGRLAQETDDDVLRGHLTEHCAEEARHAWLWTETIHKLGDQPRRVRKTYQSYYHERLGAPRSMLDILALTQVFERRVVRHFRAHLARPGTNPVIRETLQTMIEDEAGHISWVRKWLDGYASRHGRSVVQRKLREYEAIDEEIYQFLLAHSDRLAQLVAPDAAACGRTDLLGYVSESLGIPRSSLSLTTPLSSLGADSLDLVMMVLEIEERFEVELDPSELRQMATLGDLAARLDAPRAVAVG